MSKNVASSAILGGGGKNARARHGNKAEADSPHAKESSTPILEGKYYLSELLARSFKASRVCVSSFRGLAGKMEARALRRTGLSALLKLRRNLLAIRAGMAHAGCMRKKWLGIALVVFAFAAILFFVLNRGPAEPTYEGKPVTFWIKRGFWELPGSKEAEIKAKEAVLNVGTNGLPYYISCLESRDSEFKLSIIARINNWAIIHNRKLWSFPPDWLALTKRNYAFKAISILQTNASPAVPVLERILLEGRSSEKRAAANLIAMIDPHRGLVILTNALKSTNVNVKLAVLDGLTEYGNHSPASIHLRRPKSPETLAANAKAIVPILINYLNDTNEPFRWYALISLGGFSGDPGSLPKTIPIFIKYCQGGDPGLSGYAGEALEYTVKDGSSNAVAALSCLLHDTNAQIRTGAVRAFGSCRPLVKSSVPEIRKALNDPDFSVRHEATNALEFINGVRAKDFE